MSACVHVDRSARVIQVGPELEPDGLGSACGRLARDVREFSDADWIVDCSNTSGIVSSLFLLSAVSAALGPHGSVSLVGASTDLVDALDWDRSL